MDLKFWKIPGKNMKIKKSPSKEGDQLFGVEGG
jgi:hypothetical protein